MTPTVVIKMTAMVTTMVMAAPWLLTKNGTVCTPVARKMAQLWRVKPAVDKILNAGNVEQQAAVLCAVTNHPVLTAALKLAGIDLSKEHATAKYVCDQCGCWDVLVAARTPMVKQRETNIMQPRRCLHLQPHHPTGYQSFLANTNALVTLKLRH